MRDEDPAEFEMVVLRPEDMLEDSKDTREFNDVEVRKGILGAFMIDASRFMRLPESHPARSALLDEIRPLAPAVRALGVLDVFEPRSPEVRAIFTEIDVRPSGTP